MEKRVLIAAVLSVAVLMLYGVLFPPPQRPVQKAEPVKEALQEPAAASEETQAKGPAQPAAPAPSAQTSPERLVTVETPLVSAVISSRGGVIKSWRLKSYKDASGRPVEMVLFDKGVMPLLVVPDGVAEGAASAMGYVPDKEKVELGPGMAEDTLTLSYTGPVGESVVKRLVFKADTYAFGLEVVVSGFGGYRLLTGEGFGSLTSEADKGYGHVGPVTYIDGELKDRGFVNWVKGFFKGEEEKKLAEKAFAGKTGWTGITDKYFLAAIVKDGGISAVVDRGVSDWGYSGVAVSAKDGPLRARFFAGPKEYDRLKAAGGALQKAVDFGTFAFIAKPLFVALKFFFGLVGNYGWAIIIITFIIKLGFAPLTHKQQKSMKRMQGLQPMVNELKEKHKGDPQRMNREMMELYKKHKVNPLGGCLPMLVQIPVFIALYNVLNNAIELRQSPFAWWLTDLSAKDPYYVLPVLMGLSMFAMQKMTPTTLDKAQNRIMMLMPVILTFMFISLPSGLVLYFTISNLLSMAQQYYINRFSKA